MKRIRVLLAHNHAAFTTSVATFLSGHLLVDIVGRTGRGQDAIALAHAMDADQVLVDVTLDDMSGLEVARKLKMLPNPPKVILSSLHGDAEYQYEAESAGADGFISKEEIYDRLLPMMFELAEPTPAMELAFA